MKRFSSILIAASVITSLAALIVAVYGFVMTSNQSIDPSEVVDGGYFEQDSTHEQESQKRLLERFVGGDDFVRGYIFEAIDFERAGESGRVMHVCAGEIATLRKTEHICLGESGLVVEYGKTYAQLDTVESSNLSDTWRLRSLNYVEENDSLFMEFLLDPFRFAQGIYGSSYSPNHLVRFDGEDMVEFRKLSAQFGPSTLSRMIWNDDGTRAVVLQGDSEGGGRPNFVYGYDLDLDEVTVVLDLSNNPDAEYPGYDDVLWQENRLSIFGDTVNY